MYSNINMLTNTYGTPGARKEPTQRSRPILINTDTISGVALTPGRRRYPLKGRTNKEITNQDCSRFTEGSVTGWLTTPKVIVIKRWEVIMNQRCRMQGLKRRCTPQADLFSRRSPPQISNDCEG
jgi:hypothetical protein